MPPQQAVKNISHSNCRPHHRSYAPLCACVFFFFPFHPVRKSRIIPCSPDRPLLNTPLKPHSDRTEPATAPPPPRANGAGREGRRRRRRSARVLYCKRVPDYRRIPFSRTTITINRRRSSAPRRANTCTTRRTDRIPYCRRSDPP